MVSKLETKLYIHNRELYDLYKTNMSFAIKLRMLSYKAISLNRLKHLFATNPLKLYDFYTFDYFEKNFIHYPNSKISKISFDEITFTLVKYGDTFSLPISEATYTTYCWALEKE